MNLFIGCSSSNDIPDKYLIECKKYLLDLFNLDNNLVFGAYNAGLMGLAYGIATNNEKEIIGVCPIVFKEDLFNLNCNKKIVTNDILDRTKVLIEEADALIFLPGGIGTILELMAAIDMKRNGEFDKPIIIYNCCNFFDGLLNFLDKIYNEKFTSNDVEKCYYIVNNVKETFNLIKND